MVNSIVLSGNITKIMPGEKRTSFNLKCTESYVWQGETKEKSLYMMVQCTQALSEKLRDGAHVIVSGKLDSFKKSDETWATIVFANNIEVLSGGQSISKDDFNKFSDDTDSNVPF